MLPSAKSLNSIYSRVGKNGKRFYRRETKPQVLSGNLPNGDFYKIEVARSRKTICYVYRSKESYYKHENPKKQAIVFDNMDDAYEGNIHPEYEKMCDYYINNLTKKNKKIKK